MNQWLCLFQTYMSPYSGRKVDVLTTKYYCSDSSDSRQCTHANLVMNIIQFVTSIKYESIHCH